MPTPEERRDMIDDVREKLRVLADIDPQSLARSELGKGVNFEAAVPSFEIMIDFCRELSQRDIDSLTASKLSAVQKSCVDLLSLINEVRTFSLEQQHPTVACKNLVERINNTWDAIVDPFLLPLAFTATQSTDFNRIEREAKGFHATMKEEAENLAGFVAETRHEATNALSAVKQVAAEAGVATNAEIFDSDADLHSESAKKWFWATLVMAVLTIGFAVVGLVVAFKYSPPNTATVVQIVVGKLLILSTLSFALFWCARNYKAEKHNETSNRHRANALKTFKAFVEGTADDRVKDAILLQASQAAFSSRATGYDSHEKEAQTISPIVEVIGKTLSKTSGGGTS